MRFGTMLKQAREAAGLTQEQLAAKTGLPIGSIRNWEQNHRMPRLDVVPVLANAVKVPVERMLLAMVEEAGRQKKAKKNAGPKSK